MGGRECPLWTDEAPRDLEPAAEPGLPLEENAAPERLRELFFEWPGPSRQAGHGGHDGHAVQDLPE
jgi:hypothetical protein